MRIFAVGDLHQDETLKQAVIDETHAGSYDLMIGIGDYEDPEYYLDLIEQVEVQTISVTGNWDFQFVPPENGEYHHLFNYKKIELDDYRIVLLGSVYPDDFRDQIDAFFDGVPHSKRIIASHYPPHMVGDLTRVGTRAGFPEFRDVIMRQKPAVWLCGHIHEDFGRFELMQTTVLNCAAKESGKAFAIELDEDGVSSVDEVVLVDRP